MKQWYEELFTNYANGYDQEVFTKGTIGEVDFIEKEINFDKNVKILDIGCGTGRHSIELTKRGYKVVGIDLSENQLNKAKEKAAAQNLEIDFRLQDARNEHFINEFDLVIMLCEGGFSLMETDEMNFNILQNARKALKANGKFVFTCLNALFPLYHSVADFVNAGATNTYNLSNSFDVMTFRDLNQYEVTDDDEQKKVLNCNERYYAPSEITFMLHLLNFKSVDILAAKLGAFSRTDTLTTEDFEMLVLAEL